MTPTPTPAGADEYLAEHLRDALATDDRVLQPGLEVRVLRDLVVVRGCVPTDGVRVAVGQVLRDRAGGRRVSNEVEVTPNAVPLDAEPIDAGPLDARPLDAEGGP